MSSPVDAARVCELARFGAERVRDEVVLYLVGGTTAVVEGWRPSTLGGGDRSSARDGHEPM